MFFGTDNPFAAFGGDDDMGGMGGPGARMHMGGMPARGGPSKGEAVKRTLLCTLEELYNGTTKKLKITRKRVNPDGRGVHDDEKVLEIAVKPGFKKGTTITFEGEGDEAPGVQPSDLAFIIGEKEHDRFVREGNDLVYTAKVPLCDALCGSRVALLTLDSRRLALDMPEVLSPGYSKTIGGEGMPISKTGGKEKGNLIIRFNVQFPKVRVLCVRVCVFAGAVGNVRGRGGARDAHSPAHTDARITPAHAHHHRVPSCSTSRTQRSPSCARS